MSTLGLGKFAWTCTLGPGAPRRRLTRRTWRRGPWSARQCGTFHHPDPKPHLRAPQVAGKGTVKDCLSTHSLIMHVLATEGGD